MSNLDNSMDIDMKFCDIIPMTHTHDHSIQFTLIIRKILDNDQEGESSQSLLRIIVILRANKPIRHR